jgi:hypothetical protein
MSFEKALGFGWLEVVHPVEKNSVEKRWLENVSKMSVRQTSIGLQGMTESLCGF